MTEHPLHKTTLPPRKIILIISIIPHLPQLLFYATGRQHFNFEF
jgi:hypothetical protein